MSWQDRLRAEIILTSPQGTEFRAKWKGDDIEFAKRVAQYDVPLVDGTLVQDMGMKGVSFQLTLDFEGEDNDVVAFTFCRTLAQRGTWTVVHPVYGSFTLQPIGPFNLGAKPTESGNITTVTGPWIEPLPPETQESAAQLGQRLLAEVATLNAASAQQFTDAVDLTDPEAGASVLATGTQAVAQLQASPLAGIVAGAADIQAQFATAVQQVQGLLAQTPLSDLTDIALQIQDLIQMPGLCEARINDLVSAYDSFSREILSTLPSDNMAAIGTSELVLTACLTGAAVAVSSSSPDTRDEALKALLDLIALFQAIIDGLDAVQTSTDGAYISEAQTTASLSRLEALISAYLMGMLWDLAVARRFTLDRPRATIEVAITEYGVTDASQVDAVYDMTIRTNALIGDEVILLPAGKEVVIYEGTAA